MNFVGILVPSGTPSWLTMGLLCALALILVPAVIALDDTGWFWRITRLHVLEDAKDHHGERQIVVTQWRSPTVTRRVGGPVWWVLFHSQWIALSLGLYDHAGTFVFNVNLATASEVETWYWWWANTGMILAAGLGLILLITVTARDWPAASKQRQHPGSRALRLSPSAADKLRACATTTGTTGYTIDGGPGLAQDAAEYLSDHAHPPPRGVLS